MRESSSSTVSDGLRLPRWYKAIRTASASPRYLRYGWACGSAAAAFGLVDAHRSHDALQALQAQTAAAPAATASAPIGTSPPLPSPPYLTAADELAPLGQRLISAAVRAGRPLGVELIEASAQVEPGSAQRLPRARVDLGIRGAYPSVKRVLQEALDSQQALVLQSLTVSGGTPDGVVVAQARIVVLGRPVPAAHRVER